MREVCLKWIQTQPNSIMLKGIKLEYIYTTWHKSLLITVDQNEQKTFCNAFSIHWQGAIFNFGQVCLAPLKIHHAICCWWKIQESSLREGAPSVQHFIIIQWNSSWKATLMRNHLSFKTNFFFGKKKEWFLKESGVHWPGVHVNGSLKVSNWIYTSCQLTWTTGSMCTCMLSMQLLRGGDGHCKRVCTEKLTVLKNIPCHTWDSNLLPWHASPTAYQLSYISAQGGGSFFFFFFQRKNWS